MHIILDTNIYLTDLTLDKPEYEALGNYIRTANSMLLIPGVVRSEVDKHIASTAANEAAKIGKLYSGRLGLLTGLPTEAAIRDAIKDKFDNSLKKFPRATINYSGITIDDLVQRSLNETPPFKSKGRGFRDALIWQTLLSYLKKNPKTTIALITKNSEDFGTTQLKPELAEELDRLGYRERVVYFNELGDFLDKHGQPIAFIDDEFIESSVKDLADEYGEDRADEDDLEIDYPSREFEWRVSLVEYEGFQVDRYYIYRTTKTQYHVSVDVTLIYNVDLEGSSMEWGFDPTEGDIDWHPEYTEEHTGGFRGMEVLLAINKKDQTIGSVSIF